MGRKDALKAYNSVNVSSNAAYADQVQLIQMLFDGLIESLDKAVGHIQRKELKDKNETIGRAQKIIFGLQMSLDMEKGGELSRNLNELYEYAVKRLLHAHTRNDVDAVIEVKSLINESKWGMEHAARFIKKERYSRRLIGAK